MKQGESIAAVATSWNEPCATASAPKLSDAPKTCAHRGCWPTSPPGHLSGVRTAKHGEVTVVAVGTGRAAALAEPGPSVGWAAEAAVMVPPTAIDAAAKPTTTKVRKAVRVVQVNRV